jgi:hypothetical protein
MKKSVMMAMAAAAMLLSCEKNEPEAVADVKESAHWVHTTWTFNVGPGVSHEAMARTRADLSAMNLTDLWVMDYVGDDLVQTVHQSSTDDGFGSVTLDLGYGEHTICFCASRGTGPSVSGSVITWEKPSDTFWHSLALTVAAGTPVTAQQVTLSRIATRLRISPTDKIPEGAAKLTCSPSVWYYGFDLLTGEASGERVQQREIAIPATYVGTVGELSASFFGLSPSEPWQTDVAVAVLDGDGSVMGSVTLDGVTMSRNVTTIYSGGIFGKGGTMSVTADDGWSAKDVHEW